ncbi:MAG: hypothetical protein AAFR22_21710 [Chloroflexota bacterium]
MPDEYGRNRIQFRFWLDANDPNQHDLGYELTELKKARKFAPTLRNALTLWFTLQHGRVDVLREHFPGIVSQLEGSTGDRDTLQRILAELETLKAAAPAVSPDDDTGGPVAMDVPAFDLSFDDLDLDDLAQTVDVENDDNAAQNLINSLMNL